uniref:NADH-ubiquinone oxidoreductase chain 5 n=1 Tax=Neochloris aquatica TaxID=3099 RepID=A0A076VF51_9CHLO|nr:NADH dehydrogenase subunit 5 [Neochloris aquatica]AIK29168.1 NADH dehydrogenase subunit 5 [Neochloris aquatica]
MYLCAILSPFLGRALAGLTGRFIGARGSGCVTVLGLFISRFFSFLIYNDVLQMGAPVILELGSWFSVQTVNVTWTLCFDLLSTVMMVTVSTVSFCVHLYSLGYMMADPHLPRFLSYLSLFTGSMLLLVTGTDLVTMLVGWEMIGVCSYLLIGFWFSRLSLTKARQKAVLVNRVSDTGLLVGLMVSWWYLGSTDYSVICYTRTLSYYVDLLCLFLLTGLLGKSAQVGLHVWLLDLMEGPTPVSALIHLATLVTAGVYLVLRTSSLWEASVFGRSLLIWVGLVTSLMALTLGLVQNDLKRVILYSTCSQLGYMMVALGLSSYGLAMFHLMTHLCFKALLFLGLGVLIHLTSNVQDMRTQGAAHRALPWAWACLLLGSLSLTGWPFLAGYYSKDLILELCWATNSLTLSFLHFILMAVACMTSAYSFRLLYSVFYDKPTINRVNLSVPGAHPFMTVPLVILAIGSIVLGYVYREALIGWGSLFWGTSVQNSPLTTSTVRSHMIPVWASFLPLITVPVGICFRICFSMYSSLAVRFNVIRKIYLFLQARWMFDFVWNSLVLKSVLKAGQYTGLLVDKGVLEVLGPRGLQHTLVQAVPRIQQWQTGTVNDYALLFLIVVILGLIAYSLPVSSLESLSSVLARYIMVCLLLIVVLP